MIQNRITSLFEAQKKDVLNIYFTAGYPALHDTTKVLQALQDSGVDMVEIGMPYSDPLADGPIIQHSSTVAIETGMTIRVLLEQLRGIRSSIHIPILLMGYINPILQYGVEAFCEAIAEIGIDGLILPDLPMAEYETHYRALFEKHNISNIFLITPQTSLERVRQIDASSTGFIYIVSTNSTTGSSSKTISDATTYFREVQGYQLTNPTLIGFNIKDKNSFDSACEYANGAIIGSAFVKMLGESVDLKKDIASFVQSIKKEPTK
jgi:tryptophan synthase alpha chain